MMCGVVCVVVLGRPCVLCYGVCHLVVVVEEGGGGVLCFVVVGGVVVFRAGRLGGAAVRLQLLLRGGHEAAAVAAVVALVLLVRLGVLHERLGAAGAEDALRALQSGAAALVLRLRQALDLLHEALASRLVDHHVALQRDLRAERAAALAADEGPGQAGGVGRGLVNQHVPVQVSLLLEVHVALDAGEEKRLGRVAVRIGRFVGVWWWWWRPTISWTRDYLIRFGARTLCFVNSAAPLVTVIVANKVLFCFYH